MKRLAGGCAAIFMAALLPASILGQKVTSEFDEAQDFAGYKTFTILPGQIHSPSPALDNPLVKKMMESSIRKYLTAKGLSEVRGGPHDLNIQYSLGPTRPPEGDRYPAGWRGYGPGGPGKDYAQGTLVLDFRDTRNRQLVWRAVAIEEKQDPIKIKDKLDDMLKKSIDKYPPKPR